MKRATLILFFLVLAFDIFPQDVTTQGISTQGTDFWVSFMGNGYKDRYSYSWFSWHCDFTWLRVQLIVSAKRDCNCTIKNPNTGYEQSFQVEANSIYLFDNIPWEEAYMELDEYGQALNKGLHVTSTDTISVFCANIAEKSFDASYVLPTPALGDEYIIQTYNQSILSEDDGPYNDFHTSAFLIVATEEGETTIDITPTVRTLDDHDANNRYSITLQQGQTYQVRSHTGNSSRDLSGTRVTAHAGKKIAIFNGNNLTKIPNEGIDSDCIFEQAMPLSAWGKQFVVTASLGREKNDIVKITSAHDNNEIRKNGMVLTTLNTGQSTTFELSPSDHSCFIEAAESCAVYLYNHSIDYNNNFSMGAPSMVWIAPIEQRINDITFSTFNYESEHDTDIRNHYVNIIVETNDVDQVYLDDNLLPSNQFEPVSGNPQYSFCRKSISHDVHQLRCPNGLNAHVYGFGNARGYAYMVGSKAVNIAEDEEEEEEFIHHNPEPENRCDSIVWHGRTYTTSGQYSDTVTDGLIHDIYHLDLDLTYSPTPKMNCATNFAEVYGDTVAVVTNTEFFSFQYDFFIEDTLGHINDWEFYDWHISKPSWTIETFDKNNEPNKHYCRVYVAERSDEFVELSCTVYNHCIEDSIVCTFYLNSSFFGIDEQETAFADFNLYPNPTVGDITIEAEGMSRIVVANVLGQVIYDTQANESKTTLDLGQLGNGVYMIRIYTENGMGVKRVSVIR